MKRKTIRGLIVIVAIVAVAMFAGCVEEEAPTPTSTKVWTYKIFSEEDVSFGNTIRVVEMVSVPRNITEEGVKAVAKDVVQKVIASRDVNIIMTFSWICRSARVVSQQGTGA